MLITNKDYCIYVRFENIHETDTELKDYKLMCFNGKVVCTYVCSERRSSEGLKITFYDREWKQLPVRRSSYPTATIAIPKPTQYDEMIRLSEELSKDIPFVRSDFYEVNGHLYFGELTLYPAGGFEKFNPYEWDERFGDMIKLPNMTC